MTACLPMCDPCGMTFGWRPAAMGLVLITTVGCSDDLVTLDAGRIAPDAVVTAVDAAQSEDSGPLLNDSGQAPADAAPQDGGATPDADDILDTGSIADAEPLDMGSTPDAGTNSHRGTCRSSADCGGRDCVRIPSSDDGWHTCLQTARREATACTMGPAGDDCCNSTECTAGDGGRCFEGPLWYCGGPAPRVRNVCTYPECTRDDDCVGGTNGVCVPAEAFGEHRARCVYGGCRRDADCSSRAGGQCRPFFSPCHRRFVAFDCTYDDSECRQNADCPPTGPGAPYCARGADGAATCEAFIPPP